MELKGKPLTLGAKVVAAMIVLMALVATSCGYPVDMRDAIQAAGFIVLIFSPIDISMVLNNIFAGRNK